jgi:hypothetical protein
MGFSIKMQDGLKNQLFSPQQSSLIDNVILLLHLLDQEPWRYEVQEYRPRRFRATLEPSLSRQ